ncbi:MAG: RimK-like ATPgrasp N-terminal domain-containing protein [Pseudomonadota bacterium]
MINLCSELDYLGTGYYVSLLAQARGQRSLPTGETLNALGRKALVDLQLDGLAPLLGDLARQGSLPGDQLALRVLFGECREPGLARLARRLFERLPCPLLEARLVRRHAVWRLTRLRPLRLRDLAAAEQDLFASALNRHSRKVWRSPKARRRYRFDMAILVDPQEALPPQQPWGAEGLHPRRTQTRHRCLADHPQGYRTARRVRRSVHSRDDRAGPPHLPHGPASGTRRTGGDRRPSRHPALHQQGVPACPVAGSWCTGAAGDPAQAG